MSSGKVKSPFQLFGLISGEEIVKTVSHALCYPFQGCYYQFSLFLFPSKSLTLPFSPFTHNLPSVYWHTASPGK
ncbi:hypothetical protein OIU74_012887 [Salix koriyanagi]|uniref:Uncharacterized protein n=1 Tax=Salix koriyanagi TaxID=2511006 RepID=A0A9Q0Q828_9ROSI|nr:hypothetical protein OIU74_012887 [Salix koriyanagi]